LASIRPALATRSGATLYAVNLSSLLHHQLHSVCYVDFSSTYFGSSTTSPTASIGRRHGLRASHPTTTCKSFIWCPHVRHTRLRRQGESRIRVPAIIFDYPRHSGATDEGMTPRSSIFAYLVPAKEEARSKDTRSPQGPALRLGVEGENYL
jgi:hypothetical protein